MNKLINAVIPRYHAHIYFDPSTANVAKVLRQQIEEKFSVIIGRWHEKPIGPHPKPMYQVAFQADIFSEFIPWLIGHREVLDIFIHADSELGDYLDHTQGVIWLGNSHKLNLDNFIRSDT